MAENNQKFQCSGNCLNCLPAQRQYCASQHAYSNMLVLDKMMETVVALQGTVRELAEKIEAIQSSEAAVFDPNGAGERLTEDAGQEETAQEEDGAKNRSSHK